MVSVRRWSDAVDALVEGPERRYVVVGGTNMWIRLWLQGQVGAPEVDEGVRHERLETEELYLSLKRLIRRAQPSSTLVIGIGSCARWRTSSRRAPAGQSTSRHGWGERGTVFALVYSHSAWLHERTNPAPSDVSTGLVDEAALRSRPGQIRPTQRFRVPRRSSSLTAGSTTRKPCIAPGETLGVAKNQGRGCAKSRLSCWARRCAGEEDAEVLAQRAIALVNSGLY